MPAPPDHRPAPRSPGELIAILVQVVANGTTVAERVEALRLLGKQAKPSEAEVLPTVIAALGDEAVRASAASVLVSWGTRSVPRLLETLRGTSREELILRRAIIAVLGDIGPDAAAAKLYLEHLKQQKDPLSADIDRTLPRLQHGWGSLQASLVNHAIDVSLLLVAAAMPILGFRLLMPPEHQASVNWITLGVGIAGAFGAFLLGKFMGHQVAGPNRDDRYARVRYLGLIVLLGAAGSLLGLFASSFLGIGKDFLPLGK